MEPEFDGLSDEYERLLRDPIRDRFMGAASDFFHIRKRDLIREYFHRQGRDSGQLAFLDVGCGKGELLTLLKDDFVQSAGCDPSGGMLGGSFSKEIETRLQPAADKIPYDDATFDFVTAVCVYHHVPPALRDKLTMEVRRVLKPNGIFAIIEHNPYNPVTKLVTSRTPVDADAILLTRGETRSILRRAAFRIEYQPFFLFLPKSLYSKIGALEGALRSVPLGGQYAVFGRVEPRP
jgi:SAM-dependent methyltransferase